MQTCRQYPQRCGALQGDAIKLLQCHSWALKRSTHSPFFFRGGCHPVGAIKLLLRPWWLVKKTICVSLCFGALFWVAGGRDQLVAALFVGCEMIFIFSVSFWCPFLWLQGDAIKLLLRHSCTTVRKNAAVTVVRLLPRDMIDSRLVIVSVHDPFICDVTHM